MISICSFIKQLLAKGLKCSKYYASCMRENDNQKRQDSSYKIYTVREW